LSGARLAGHCTDSGCRPPPRPRIPHARGRTHARVLSPRFAEVHESGEGDAGDGRQSRAREGVGHRYEARHLRSLGCELLLRVARHLPGHTKSRSKCGAKWATADEAKDKRSKRMDVAEA